MQRHMPIGYKLVDGKVVSDTKKTETIQKVFNDYLNGSSIRKIAEKLTATGFPNADNKPSWNHGSVGRILENIKYLGDEMYPQIIDEETFHSVQKRRKSRNKGLCRTQEINSKKNESIFIGKLIASSTNLVSQRPPGVVNKLWWQRPPGVNVVILMDTIFQGNSLYFLNSYI